MSLRPLLTASPVIVAHASLALAAIITGGAQFVPGALVIAGGFTLLPGRIMHGVVFGAVQGARACG